MMSRTLVVLFALVSMVVCNPTMTFDEYVVKYNKQYTASEFRLRKQIFEQKVKEIVAHNTQGTSTHVKGINHLTDQTETEISRLFGFNKFAHAKLRSQRQAVKPQVQRKIVNDFPAYVNWVEKGATTPVKDQGGCGSCWAFAGTESIESCTYLNTGVLLTLAPQAYVDCVNNPDRCGGSGGCEGATPDILFQYARINGSFLESDYPYHAADETCLDSSRPVAATIGGFQDVENNNYEALMTAVVGQPVTVGVAASNWPTYSGGVFSPEECGVDVNHAVLLVGYGTDDKLGDYWLVQNSWGPGWGENGFIRLKRTANDSKVCQDDTTPDHGFGCTGGPTSVTVCGTCGILYGASYPTDCALP